MKAKKNLYRRIAVALGSIQYGVCSDTEALNDMATLLEDMLDMIDSSKLIVIDYVGDEMEDGNNETL